MSNRSEPQALEDPSPAGSASAAGRGPAIVRRVERAARTRTVNPVRPAGEGTTSADLYRLAHRVLRGRYWLLILLGLLGAGTGGIIGWLIGDPVYRSEGLIRFAYQLPTVWQETDQNRPMQMFDAFMQSQQTVIASRRIVDLAVLEPAWQATRRGGGPDVVKRFGKSLLVEFKLRTQHLKIAYTDPDPVVAAAAVNAIITAYSREYASQESHQQVQRLAALEERRKELNGQIDAHQVKIRNLAAEVGSEAIGNDRLFERLYEAKLQQVNLLATALTNIRMALASAEENASIASSPRGPGATTQPLVLRPSAPRPPLESLTTEKIAMADNTMRNYLAERSRQQDLLEELRQKFGESHPQMAQALRTLRRLDERIEQYATAYREYQASLALQAPQTAAEVVITPVMAAAAVEKSPQALRREEKRIGDMYEHARQEMLSLGSKRMQSEELRASLEKVRTELAEITRRVGVLQMENTFGRLQVISDGQVPVSAFANNRVRMAMLGTVAGGSLTGGVFVILMLLNRRLRYSDQTETEFAAQTGAPLLGVLPKLPDRVDDWQAATDAAQCVHQIRVLLQVARPRGAYLVTSSCAGEGKTSLAMALGMSFAASGSRTLVIDCDLVGQRLSRNLDGHKAGGLDQALASGSLGGCLTQLGRDLFLLPVGRARAVDACTLSVAGVQRLLTEARKYFHTVIIDSGPVLGSIEAQVVAPQVDSVIFTVARGQRPAIVQRAMKHLDSIGARVGGFVFNHAQPRDLYRSIPRSSVRSGSPEDQALARRRLPLFLQAPGQFGPLVQSVASCMPSGEDELPPSDAPPA